MTAPIQTVHIVRQGLAGPPGPAGAGGAFTEIATQADAEAGLDNVKGMTPLRVQQKVTLDLNAAVAGLVDSAPATLDTLNKLAGALGDDPDFATTTTGGLGNRLRFDAAQALDGTQKAQAQSNIGLVIGASVQAYSANGASFAGLVLAADKLPYATAANTFALADLTAAGRAMIGAADTAAQLALLAPIPNTSLANSSVTISGRALSLGGSLDLAQADIFGLTTADSPAFAGMTIGAGLLLTYTNSTMALIKNDSGSMRVGSGIVAGQPDGNPRWGSYSRSDFSLGSGYSLGWSSGPTITTVPDTTMTRAAAGVVAFNGTIQSSGWPTSDPGVAGRVWSNAGVLTVSAG